MSSHPLASSKWNVIIDLTVLAPRDQVSEVGALTGRCRHGHKVTVHVDSTMPHHLAPRVAHGLFEARPCGLGVALAGSPRALRAWCNESSTCPSLPSRFDMSRWSLDDA